MKFLEPHQLRRKIKKYFPYPQLLPEKKGYQQLAHQGIREQRQADQNHPKQQMSEYVDEFESGSFL